MKAALAVRFVARALDLAVDVRRAATALPRAEAVVRVLARAVVPARADRVLAAVVRFFVAAVARLTVALAAVFGTAFRVVVLLEAEALAPVVRDRVVARVDFVDLELVLGMIVWLRWVRRF